MKIFSDWPSLLRQGFLLALGLLLASPAGPVLAQPAASTPQPSALNNGSPAEASKYYKEISTKLGILTPTTIETQATFKSLLDYLGYKEFAPADIEFAAPESLMGGTAGAKTLAQVLPVGSKVSLKADTGSFFARCNNCQTPVTPPLPDTVTVHITSVDAAPYAVFEVVDAGNGKIALKADTGKYVARCDRCIAKATITDFATVHATGTPPPAYAQFTPELLANGKVAFKADTGKYLARCRDCSPTATTPDTVTVTATDAQKQPEAQWTIVPQTTTPSGKDFLVSRFFAPKIVNFSTPPAQRKVGWRRLVRLNARPGSAAQKHFVDSAWVLFNHFTDPSDRSPFDNTNPPPSAKNSSTNTQVALVTHCLDGQTACQDAALNSIYWMDFDTSEKGYKLSYQLNAFFDAGSLPGGAPYFVPNGCDTCHGSLRGNAVLNHLDTDHWVDRLADGDFPTLSDPAAPPVLFDAGKDVKSAQYAAGFDVLRRLNQEISTMQQGVEPNGFHLAATRKWLDIHKTSVAPEPDLTKRAVDFFNTGHPLKKDRKPTSGPLNWTSSAEDKETLGLMNKYCYRCHGAIRYDVFSKDMVADQSSPILDRLEPNPTQAKIIGFKMPVDREMDAKDRKRLLELIEKLYDQTH